MAHIEKRTRGDGRPSWRARYRTPAGAHRSRSFDRKVDAERFLATVESSKTAGAFIDPTRARLTVGEWAQRWLAGQSHLKATTFDRYQGAIRKHINPVWQDVRLSHVRHGDVQAWVAELTRTQSPASVRKIHRVLSLILDTAVKDGRLGHNAAASVNLPRPTKHEHRYLTHTQVDLLALAAGYPAGASKHASPDTKANETYRLVVLFLAYTGVRFGEMAALRVRRLDLTRRRAVIAESVTPVQGKGMVWSTPKSHQWREVSLPAFLVVDLARLIDGKADDELVFGGIRNGAPLRVSTFRTAFTAAAITIGIPDLHPHELRHTAASLAIASGADVKVVQKMLGHASATMTLDTYGHLFDDRLDEVADAMTKARDAERAALSLDVAGNPASNPRPNDHLDTEVGKEKGHQIRIPAGQAAFRLSTPDRIRTGATALRGRRARPLHNGGVKRTELYPRRKFRPNRWGTRTRT